jgi:myo-inositol-1-phosphate synthase
LKQPARHAARARAVPPARGRLGVWVFGALGGLATTLVAGARAIARGRSEPHGLITETPLFAGADLAPIDRLVFGGHEIRAGSLFASALEIHESTGAIPYQLAHELEKDLAAATARIRRGTLINAGATIARLAGGRPAKRRPLRVEVDRIAADLRRFMREEKLSRCVCVNLISTEPNLPQRAAHRSLRALEAAIDADRVTAVRPSSLYAYAAASLGLPFIHFTPCNAALTPAIVELFDRSGTPFMGADGKTGETLVKSTLAPMFKYRNLRVLAWQGYNILGDRDGVVLANAANKRAKVESKDGLLGRILGYPLHTHVGIDYVPSLSDLKTAWDFIHFQGFLGFKMSMQFIWQGCDAILAAPLVLDMVRLADLAQRRGERGPMRHLACFFKRPLGVDEQDLHAQWDALKRYAEAARSGR